MSKCKLAKESECRFCGEAGEIFFHKLYRATISIKSGSFLLGAYEIQMENLSNLRLSYN